jgi:LacI family transcriptional regulator, repressor for deo operon, udp, cdd, tsx, nupC, and nupG
VEKVGIRAVAREAGVSEATVSRVLNNRGVVAPATRQAVDDAIRLLGYRSRSATGKIVLLIAPGLDNPFFARLCDRITAGLGAQGLLGVVASAPVGGVQEHEYIASMVDVGIVGAVFVAASNTLLDAHPSAHRLLISRGVPFVCINGPFADADAPVLTTNDARAAELSVEHLWKLGHRRIGLLAGPHGNRVSDRRVAGFHEAMAQRVGSDPVVVHTEYSIEGGATAARTALDKGVSAVVGASDGIALGALRTFARSGRRVPEDISVVGYDDAHPLEFVDPPLTTVRQPIERLAEATVPLLQRLTYGQRVDASELLFDPDLIIRGSTGPAPSGS